MYIITLTCVRMCAHIHVNTKWSVHTYACTHMVRGIGDQVVPSNAVALG